MKKVVTLGSATQDIFILYEDAATLHLHKTKSKKTFLLLEQGVKIDVNRLEYATGGGSTNAAVSLKRLGFDVASFFKIGTDKAGQYIQEQLTHEQINIAAAVCNRTISTAISFIIPTPNKDYTALAYRGENTEFTKQEVPTDLIADTDLVYITSLPGNAAHLLPDICAYAKKHTARVATNPGMRQITHEVDFLLKALEHIDILILNKIEAHQLLLEILKKKQVAEYKTTTKKQDQKKSAPALVTYFMAYNNSALTIFDYFRIISTMGPSIVVVTNGAEGVYVGTAEACYFHPSIPTEIVSTVGAGDAFGSCFVGCLEMGMPIEQAILYGVLNSSSVLNYFGPKTGLLTLEHLHKKAQQVAQNLLQQFKSN